MYYYIVILNDSITHNLYMASFDGIYQLEKAQTESGLRYLFISEGDQDIIKAIQYSFIQKLGGQDVYNLGFGDYDIEADTLDDKINSNNGDVYKIFNTVLSTIPTFFEAFKGAILMVHGSDSTQSFLDACKAACIKKCENDCKNFKRRINLYRRYVNKNFEPLSVDYQFIGGTLNE
jgi:hypothetical protein